MTEATPAIEGWFTTDAEPDLLGPAVHDVRHRVLPAGRRASAATRPAGEEFDDVELSRAGTVWTYTDAQYQPPPPYIPRERPLRAVRHRRRRAGRERMVVLGQVADGYGVGRPRGRRGGGAGRRDALRGRRRRPLDLAVEAGRRAGRGADQ